MKRGRRRWLAAALALGCAGRAAGPADAVVAYGQALERGDLRAAYQQMSARLPAAGAVRAVRARAGRAPAAREGGRVVRLAGERGRSRAEVTLAPGERALLVQDAGAWRLDAPPLPPLAAGHAARGPARVRPGAGGRALRPADRSGARALPGGRHARTGCAATGKAQPPERRRALIAALRLSLDRPIVEDGNDAYVVMGPDSGVPGQVRLVKEEGLWRVENPE